MYGDGQDYVIAVRKGCHAVSLGSPAAEMFQLLQGLQEHSGSTKPDGADPSVAEPHPAGQLAPEGLIKGGFDRDGELWDRSDLHDRRCAHDCWSGHNSRNSEKHGASSGVHWKASRLHSPGSPGRAASFSPPFHEGRLVARCPRTPRVLDAGSSTNRDPSWGQRLSPSQSPTACDDVRHAIRVR